MLKAIPAAVLTTIFVSAFNHMLEAAPLDELSVDTINIKADQALEEELSGAFQFSGDFSMHSTDWELMSDKASFYGKLDKPDQVSLRLPAGFAGTSAQNYCLGTNVGSGVGVVVLDDLRAVLSTTYGDADFLFPKPTGVLVSAADAVFASPRDFYASLRDSAPDVGAFESTGGGNPGWTLADGFKQ